MAEQYPRDPHDWYREPRACVEQLADAIDFRDALIWDPSCGMGNILDVFAARGHAVVGSDIVDRHKPGAHRFYRGNFLQVTTWPKPIGRPLSIVCNPPYGYVKGIAAAFIHRAVNMIPFDRAAFLLPIEFLCSQGRYQFFRRHPPSHVAYCSERPSMPPGAAVAALGDRAFGGGMADYAWIVWTSGHRGPTSSIWLRPSDQ